MPNDSTDFLLQLRREWDHTGRTLMSRRALAALREHEGGDVVPTWIVDLSQLVTALEPRGGLDRLHRARLVAFLLRCAVDPFVGRCLLQTMLPGVVSVARQLRFGEGIYDDPRVFLSDAITELVELIASWAGQSRPYAAPDLLSALRCRMRRRMLAEKARRSELTIVADVARNDPDDSFARQLAAAAVRGVTDVDLLYARCVLGHTESELASAAGVSSGVLHRRLVAAARQFVATPS
jgi:hypothetical protein